MSDFSILTGKKNVPDPPVKRTRGKFNPLLAKAREAKGEWVALRAESEESTKQLSSLGSRINKGTLLNTVEGEYEARVSMKNSTLWVRHTPGDVEPEPEPEPKRAPSPIPAAPTEDAT